MWGNAVHGGPPTVQDVVAAVREADAHHLQRRISYEYGVNSGTREGTASHDDLQRRTERETQGPVTVTMREERDVYYSPWREATPAPGPADAGVEGPSTNQLERTIRAISRGATDRWENPTWSSEQVYAWLQTSLEAVLDGRFE
jgi:hypothetical protein